MWAAVLTDYLDMSCIVVTQRNLDNIRNKKKQFSSNLENNSLLKV